MIKLKLKLIKAVQLSSLPIISVLCVSSPVPGLDDLNLSFDVSWCSLEFSMVSSFIFSSIFFVLFFSWVGIVSLSWLDAMFPLFWFCCLTVAMVFVLSLFIWRVSTVAPEFLGFLNPPPVDLSDIYVKPILERPPICPLNWFIIWMSYLWSSDASWFCSQGLFIIMVLKLVIVFVLIPWLFLLWSPSGIFFIDLLFTLLPFTLTSGCLVFNC